MNMDGHCTHVVSHNPTSRKIIQKHWVLVLLFDQKMALCIPMHNDSFGGVDLRVRPLDTQNMKQAYFSFLWLFLSLFRLAAK